MERTETMTAASAPVLSNDRSYVDWPAILAGAVIATAIAAIFGAFGAALGLSAVSAEAGEGSFGLAAVIGAVWLVVSLLASYMAGGYIAGRMRRRVDHASAYEVTTRDGINGLVVWAIGIIAGVMLISGAVSTTVSAVGTAATAAGSAAGGIAQGAVSAAGPAVASMLPDQLGTDPTGYVTDTLLRPVQADADPAQSADLARQSGAILANVIATGEISDADRAYLVSAASARTGLTPAQVEARVDAAVKSAQDARAEADRLTTEAEESARNAAETARISAVLTGFVAAAAALVAAAASYVGAVRGGRHRDEGRIFGGFAYRG
jgi:hypothetical protein